MAILSTTLEGETSNGSFDISLTQGISGKADIKLKFEKSLKCAIRYALSLIVHIGARYLL